MLVHDFLDFHACRNPDAPCIIYQGATLSYGAIREQVHRLAAGLERLGVNSGQRVALLAENCPEQLVLLMAASKLGAVSVPLNYRLAPPELAFIIRDSRANVLLVPDAGMLALANTLRELVPGVTVIARGAGGEFDWDAWLARQQPEFRGERVAGDDAVLQLYTSGTTGNPKGVVTTHRNLVTLYTMTMTMTSAAARSGPAVADLTCTPNFHISGTGTVLLSVMAGGSVVLHKGFNPQAVVDDLQRYPVSSVFMVPAMIMAILHLVPGVAQMSFPNLKQIAYGASPISPSLLAQAIDVFKCDFIQCYGMTETTGTVVTLSADDHRRAMAGETHLLQSCGRPGPGVEVIIVDRAGSEVPTGETGEVWIRSDANMPGYYNLPAETEQNLTDGWIHTGDSGYKDAEGFIYLRDRIKDMVVSGAENIYPIEVENVIAAHEAVADVAVIGVPDETFGEALLACVVLRPGAHLDVDTLVEFCRGKLAGYKIPRQLKILEAMPRNASGKILKKELRKPYWENRDRAIG